MKQSPRDRDQDPVRETASDRRRHRQQRPGPARSTRAEPGLAFVEYCELVFDLMPFTEIY
jgi:hypothetical protein